MKALLLIDIQNDFLPGGALEVKEGDQILPIVNKLLKRDFDLVVATKDWHPENHGSFAATHHKEPGTTVDLDGLEQLLWPTHCVQESRGAEFSPELDTSAVDKIFYKGTDKNIDSYSAFFDNAHLRATGLGDFLREQGITDVYLAGLATDYCVKFSAFDAVELGFHVHLITDACRGVELNPGDTETALKEMQATGIRLIPSKDV